MFSTILFNIIQDKTGLSTNSSKYLARGMACHDVKKEDLIILHNQIQQQLGDDAAQNFIALVKGLKILTATNFLLALQDFDDADFIWDGTFVEKVTSDDNEIEASNVLRESFLQTFQLN